MPDLQELYAQMHELTLPKCRDSCRVPLSCCSPEYCDMAEEMAAVRGVVVEQQQHATLKYMGPGGCVMPPHLRPLCTLHVCSINAIGADISDPVWTAKYFDLRRLIEEQEMVAYL